MGYQYYFIILNTGPQSLIQNSGSQMCSGIQNFSGFTKSQAVRSYMHRIGNMERLEPTDRGEWRTYTY